MVIKMAQTNPELMRSVLTDRIADGHPHKAGDLYRHFVERTGGVGADGQPVSRKGFEMFLRSQVLKEDGCIKRIAFGVYQKRNGPEDRGELYARKRKLKVEGIESFESGLTAEQIMQAHEPRDLESLMDDAYMLGARLEYAIQSLAKSEDRHAASELQAVKDSVMLQVDRVITGISAAMAWREDYMDMRNEQNESDQGMKML